MIRVPTGCEPVGAGAVATFAAATTELSAVPLRQALVEHATPVNVTRCGLVESLSVMTSAALKAPAALGAKVTLTSQELLAATEVPQLLVCENLSGFVPATAMLVTASAALPVLVSVVVSCFVRMNLVGLKRPKSSTYG